MGQNEYTREKKIINSSLNDIKGQYEDSLRDTIVLRIIKKGGKCREKLTIKKILEVFPDSPHIQLLIGWKTGVLRKTLLKELKKIGEKRTKLDKDIQTLENDIKPNNNNDIFNNKQQNINIQNKLIYLIRYKYNLFLSILIVGLFICMYKYFIPKLNINENISN